MDAQAIVSQLVDGIATLATERAVAAITPPAAPAAIDFDTPEFRDAVRDVIDDSIDRVVDRKTEAAIDAVDFEEIIRDNVDIDSMIESALDDRSFAEEDHAHDTLSEDQRREVMAICAQRPALGAAELAALLRDPTVVGALLDVLTSRLQLTVRPC